MGSKVTGKTMKQKMKHRKGLWSPEEDQRLRDYILKNNHGCWSSVPMNAGLQRNGKSCRLRWINYLRPGLKRGRFTVHEEETILSLHRSLGNKWSQIAQHLPGRTDNEIKNYWHTYLKKKVLKPEPAVEMKNECVSADDTNCLSVHEPRHEASFTPLKPTDISSLPQSIVFDEWLNLDKSSINENNAHEREGTSLNNYFFDLDYGESDLMELLFMESMDYDASSSREYCSFLQKASPGDAIQNLRW